MRVRHLALALALVPGTVAAQASPIQPVCSADLKGDRLLTTAQFPNGYRVDGPWHIVSQKSGASSNSMIMVTAVIDRIVEFTDKDTQKVTQFPSAIEIVFRADNRQQFLEAAAMVWCQTVFKARSPQTEVKPGTFRSSITT
jgi:hypothetical protein